jgi:hypothetical protein
MPLPIFRSLACSVIIDIFVVQIETRAFCVVQSRPPNAFSRAGVVVETELRGCMGFVAV